MKPFNQLPKNKQLTALLKKELEKRAGQDHALFFTEAEISTRYDVSRTTIRQSIEQLVSEGYLYRIQGKGTFIAPKRNQLSIILVVEETIGNIRSGCYPQIDFYHGLQQYAKDTQVNVILLNCREFAGIKRDLALIYKDVDKVIFFRTSAAFFDARDELAQKNYTTLFYGSDSHFSKFNFSPEQGYPSEYFYTYREQDILSLALDQVPSSSLNRMGIAYSGKTVRLNRFQRIKQILRQRGCELNEQWTLEFNAELNDLAARTRQCIEQLSSQLDNLPDVIFSTDDWLVPAMYHAFEQLGIKVGEDISIISINNYPFAEILYPSLSTVDIPIYDDAERCAELIVSQPEQRVHFGQPSFIQRASVAPQTGRSRGAS